MLWVCAISLCYVLLSSHCCIMLLSFGSVFAFLLVLSLIISWQQSFIKSCNFLTDAKPCSTVTHHTQIADLDQCTRAFSMLSKCSCITFPQFIVKACYKFARLMTRVRLLLFSLLSGLNSRGSWKQFVKIKKRIKQRWHGCSSGCDIL